jgi:steroid Delta-isomerase
MAVEDPRIERIVARFEGLTRGGVADLAELYTADARFKDPFNEVQGTAAVQRIFEHMFVNLDEPRFVIRERIVQGDQCFLTWDFLFRMKRFSRDEQCIRGGSHLVLTAEGRIQSHRDYWDAAEELYEKLPLVGGLMRWLKGRANS